MKSYWDLSEQERAMLTDGQIEQYRKIQLMEEGVVEVPLPPEPETVDPRLKSKRFYVMKYKGKHSYREETGFAFESMEKVEAFIALGPLFIGSDYTCGDEYQFAKEAVELQVVPKDLFDPTDVQRVKAILVANKGAREEYDAAKKEAVKNSQKADKVLDRLYEDWSLCKTKLRRLRQIVATFREYVKLAGDNPPDNYYTAMRFLLKAFSREEIKESRDWDLWMDVERNIPIPEPETAKEPEPVEVEA